MKLISTSSQRRTSLPGKRPSGQPVWSKHLKRVGARFFSARTAWWIIAIVVTTFAILVFRMLRQMVEFELKDGIITGICYFL